MKISKKIHPDKISDTTESVMRQAFVTAINEMRTFPPPQLIEFYIRTNIQLSGDKAADSSLIVLGEQNTTWKQAIKAELKADKKQVMVGLASISKDGKQLQFQIELGAAKKSLVRKGIKALCNKVGLKLVFTGGEPDPEDVDTDEELEAKIDMPQSNESVKADAPASQMAQLNAQAAALQQKINGLATLSGEAHEKLRQELLTTIPNFLQSTSAFNPLPPKLAAFAEKLRQTLTQLQNPSVSAAPKGDKQQEHHIKINKKMMRLAELFKDFNALV